MEPDPIRDRITEIVELRLADVADNARNPKTHPKAQGEALRGVVSEIGWAGVPLAYRSARAGGALTFVDGHLRRREFPDLTVRVAVTDLTDAEADLLLLTYDPIAALAVADKAKMDDLLREVQASDARVTALLSETAERAGLYLDGPPPDVDFKEFTEDVENDVEYIECPQCGHKWPK